VGAENTLHELAAALREEGTLLAEHLAETDARPALGLLAAAGPRAEGAEADYAFVIEAIREGYLLHYGEPRVVVGADPDLALLAGDHLYALGLERLASLGDLEAVRELADLISLSAHVHADGKADASARRLASALWLASTTAVTAGGGAAHAAAKDMARGGSDADAASSAFAEAAVAAAAAGGIGEALEAAAEQIDFALPEPHPGG
jgi:hypothetical protein